MRQQCPPFAAGGFDRDRLLKAGDRFDVKADIADLSCKFEARTSKISPEVGRELILEGRGFLERVDGLVQIEGLSLVLGDMGIDDAEVPIELAQGVGLLVLRKG